MKPIKIIFQTNYFQISNKINPFGDRKQFHINLSVVVDIEKKIPFFIYFVYTNTFSEWKFMHEIY